MTRNRFLSLACALLAALWAGPAGAQHSKLRMERVRLDRLPDLVAYLTPVYADGTFVDGRLASDFKILVDSAELGAGRGAVPFAESKEPVYLVAVVQLSPVMEAALDEIKGGLRQLADAAGRLPRSRMGLLGYAAEVKRLCESCSAAEIGSAIGQLAVDPEGAEVRMLDAVRVAIDLLRAQPARARKLVVLVSDGIDINQERRNFVEVGRRAQREGVVIDTIGYAPFEPAKLRALLDLTNPSYGIDRSAKVPAELGPRFSALADELLKQYVVTFPLPMEADGKEHVLQVISETGGRAEYSQTLTVAFERTGGPADDEAPPPPPGRGGLWLLLLPGLGLLAAVVYLLLRRRRVRQPVSVPSEARASPALPQPVAPARTVVLPEGGDVVLGWITGLNGPCRGRDFKLGRRVVLGSAPDCDVVIADPTVSARHCELRQIPEGFKLVDLGSTNGLVVNDRRTPEHLLVDNDVFRVGRVEFKFKAI